MAKNKIKLFLGVSLKRLKIQNAYFVAQNIIKTLNNNHLHWLVKTNLFVEKDLSQKLIELLTCRVQNNLDIIIPAGYCDPPHSVLSLQELKTEIEFSLQDNWPIKGRGLKKADPFFFAPLAPDLTRMEAVQLYKKYFKALLLKSKLQEATYFFQAEQIKGFPFVFYYCLTRENLDNFKIKKILSIKEKSFFVICEPENREDAEIFAQTFKELSECHSVELSLLNENEFSRSGKKFIGSNFKTLNLSILTDVKLQMTYISKLRHKSNSTKEANKNILEAFAQGITANKDYRQTTSFNVVYTANMPGQIVLPGKDFVVRFQAGKLQGLYAGPNNILPEFEIKSFAEIDKIKFDLLFDKVFSFENEEIRGLSTSLSIKNSQREREEIGSLYYYLIVDYPWFFLTSTFNISIFNTIQTEMIFSPLSLPILEYAGDSGIEVQAIYFDGSEAKYNIKESGTYFLAGSLFNFRLKTAKYLSCGFLYPKREASFFLPVQVEKNRKNQLLRIEPFNIFLSRFLAELQTFQITTTFFLSLTDQPLKNIPQFSDQLSKIVPQTGLN